jgi:hypothetical protein
MYHKLWCNLWPQLCDIFHADLVNPEGKIIERIRELYWYLGMHKAGFGDFINVPIMQKGKHGVKYGYDDVLEDASAQGSEIGDYHNEAPL